MIHSNLSARVGPKVAPSKGARSDALPSTEEPQDAVILGGSQALASPLPARTAGPKLSFEVDPRYLAIHSMVGRLNPRNPDCKVVRDFQERAYKLDPEAFQLLRRYDWPVGSLLHEGELGRRAERLIDQMRADKDFKMIQAQTEKAAGKLAREWQSDLAMTYPILKEMTGLDLDLSLRVLVTHPGQTNGKSFGEDKILWTDRSDFPHYNSVYLWHEALHKVIRPTEETMNVANPSHALIELLADNELRVRLNGGSCPPFEGHPENECLRQAMMPSFQAYLKQPKKDLQAYLKSAEAIFS